jgi:hypothetical protein
METYRNLKGDSGVRAYEIGRDSITVAFSGGAVYRYTYESAGASHVEEMKKLARAGRGLSGYISRYVRASYASRKPA